MDLFRSLKIVRRILAGNLKSIVPRKYKLQSDENFGRKVAKMTRIGDDFQFFFLNLKNGG